MPANTSKDALTFVRQLVGAVLMALAPVVFTAFVSLPWSLNRHPGEPPMASTASAAGGVLVATDHPT